MQYRQNIARHFYDWIKVKMYLDWKARKPAIHEGEIWWASVGQNVGVEINGKNANFSRPVLILRKYNFHSFMAIPLTTKKHNDTRYIPIEMRGKKSYGILIQARTMSVSRLRRRIGTIPESELEAIADEFCSLHAIKKKITPPANKQGGGAGNPEQ